MRQQQIQKGKQRKGGGGGGGHNVRQTVQYGRSQTPGRDETVVRSQRRARPEAEQDLLDEIDKRTA